MHRLLKRQLKRHLAQTEKSSELKDFLQAVDEAYQQADNERSLIERSLELASEELSERNQLLKQEVQKQQAFQQELAESLAALNATFDSTGEAILVFNKQGKVSKYNKMAARILELTDDEHSDEAHIDFRQIFGQLTDPIQFSQEISQIKTDPLVRLFGLTTLTDGRIFEYHSSPQMRTGEFLGRVWCFRDITELKQNEATIQHQAHHDALTNLPNRALLDDRIEHAVHYAKRFSTKLAILFIDLDDFKKVNDNAGHHAGDYVLKKVAKRVKSCIREHDTLSRLGGDEFVVLLENIKDPEFAALSSQRIIEKLSLPFKIEENEYFISSSIGISIFPRDADEPKELMRKADMAMYHAKSLGKCNFQYFDEEIERSSTKQLKIENQLRLAIDNQEFKVNYQPKIDLSNRQVNSLEALIRWTRPDGTVMRPDEFIPVAEQTGLINHLGQWIQRKVCQDIKAWQKLDLPILPVSINVSPVEFRNKELFEQFEDTLIEFNPPMGSIEIEITESLFFDNIDYAKEMLERLRSLKITVAVDDFGTGYSSLKYLHQLPIDVLKIDKSFITKLDNNANNAAIADSIINLAHNLKLKVVAEGVEDETSLKFLIDRGCDMAQGYLFHQPQDFEQICDLLATQSLKLSPVT